MDLGNDFRYVFVFSNTSDKRADVILAYASLAVGLVMVWVVAVAIENAALMKCHVLIWFAIVVLEPFRSWFVKLTASHVSRSFMID